MKHQYLNLKLAAIDLDGTLLGPDSRISEENRTAITRLSDAGLEIVLASGRHYQAMRPYALQLPMVNWLISSQGGEVGDLNRYHVLARSFLSPADVAQLKRMKDGFSAIFYSPEGVFTEDHANQRTAFYSELSGHTPSLATHSEIQELSVYKILWIGDPVDITGLRNQKRFADLGLLTVQTHERIFEFMPQGTSKASALASLATHLGMEPANVVAFGDGENDIPMFDWAGLSFAMPHGWPNALTRAARIGSPGARPTALARCIDELLLEVECT